MIYYLPLEPYQERNTYQLKQWTEAAFKRHGLEFETIEPFGLGDNAIIQNTGPLDYWRRTRWSLLQTEKLIQRLQETDSKGDVIYTQDMFHPGIEALFYIYSQKPIHHRPKIFVQNCAQSMDIYDFTYPMMDWMRRYEQMCDVFCAGIFVASSIHAELMRVSGFKNRIFVTGLPFDKDEVQQRLESTGEKVIPWEEKDNRVVFSSRFDKEKKPHFFLDFVQKWKSFGPDLEFAILQGGKFNSNDPSAISRAREMEEAGLLTIHEELSKEDYYKILNRSKIWLNTALQDFVSTTLNEASTFGVKPLAPAFRAFPEALDSNEKYLYIPWSHESMSDKLKALLDTPFHGDVYRPAIVGTEALDWVCGILQGDQFAEEVCKYEIFN